jgi:dTDP-4-amino-4,6-dideoxygalactose transaminase
MTTGEGGAVLCNDGAMNRVVESLRDWGRDCWCPPGADNTCGARFTQQFGALPCGYDHKYTYSHLGFNLKMTDMQAAVGCAQLEKLEGFGAARRRKLGRAAGDAGRPGRRAPAARADPRRRSELVRVHDHGPAQRPL